MFFQGRKRQTPFKNIFLIKVSKLIHCASCFPEDTLGFCDECRGFEKAGKTVIYQSFYLTYTASQCYRAKLFGSLESFPGLAIGIILASLQEGGNSPVSQVLLINYRRHWSEVSGRSFKIW